MAMAPSVSRMPLTQEHLDALVKIDEAEKREQEKRQREFEAHRDAMLNGVPVEDENSWDDGVEVADADPNAVPMTVRNINAKDVGVPIQGRSLTLELPSRRDLNPIPYNERVHNRVALNPHMSDAQIDPPEYWRSRARYDAIERARNKRLAPLLFQPVSGVVETVPPELRDRITETDPQTEAFRASKRPDVPVDDPEIMGGMILLPDASGGRTAIPTHASMEEVGDDNEPKDEPVGDWPDAPTSGDIHDWNNPNSPHYRSPEDLAIADSLKLADERKVGEARLLSRRRQNAMDDARQLAVEAGPSRGVGWEEREALDRKRLLESQLDAEMRQPTGNFKGLKARHLEGQLNAAVADLTRIRGEKSDADKQRAGALLGASSEMLRGVPVDDEDGDIGALLDAQTRGNATAQAREEARLRLQSDLNSEAEKTFREMNKKKGVKGYSVSEAESALKDADPNAPPPGWTLEEWQAHLADLRGFLSEQAAGGTDEGDDELRAALEALAAPQPAATR